MLNKTAIYVFCLFLSCVAVNAQTKLIHVHENSLRKKAVTSVMPKFPSEARRAKASGVAVGQVIVNEDGQVSEVEVVEASHPSIKQAVEEALHKWKFMRFVVRGKPHKVKGKLIFFFVNDERGARVENPYPW